MLRKWRKIVQNMYSICINYQQFNEIDQLEGIPERRRFKETQTDHRNHWKFRKKITFSGTSQFSLNAPRVHDHEIRSVPSDYNGNDARCFHVCIVIFTYVIKANNCNFLCLCFYLLQWLTQSTSSVMFNMSKPS